MLLHYTEFCCIRLAATLGDYEQTVRILLRNYFQNLKKRVMVRNCEDRRLRESRITRLSFHQTFCHISKLPLSLTLVEDLLKELIQLNEVVWAGALV